MFIHVKAFKLLCEEFPSDMAAEGAVGQFSVCCRFPRRRDGLWSLDVRAGVTTGGRRRRPAKTNANVRCQGRRGRGGEIPVRRLLTQSSLLTAIVDRLAFCRATFLPAPDGSALGDDLTSAIPGIARPPVTPDHRSVRGQAHRIGEALTKPDISTILPSGPSRRGRTGSRRGHR